VELEKIAAGVLSPLGYDILEARLKSEGHKRVLLVRIERKDEVPIAVSDLEQANRALSSHLDQHDLLAGEDPYLLQVESPGAERPLFTARHFERFMGLKVKVKSPQGNFTGRVQKVGADEVDFLLDSKETRTLKLGTFKANLAEWPDKPR